MQTWLDKLVEPLLNPQYPQIKGQLVKYDYFDSHIEGKCAEGEIACQNGIKYSKYDMVLSIFHLKLLGIPDDFLNNFINISFDNLSDQLILDIENNPIDNIGRLIINLNDFGYTYPEIAEFLKTTFEDAV